MSKDTYFFSHDAHARRDPKIIAMMTIYGAAGYGYYWILVEMMREQNGYKLKVDGKYDYKVIKTELDIDTEENAKEFVNDCVEEFGLFRIEDGHLVSDSLLSRMKHLDDKRAQAKAAAEIRWGKKNKDKKKTTKKVAIDLPFEDDEPKHKVLTQEEVFLKVFNASKKEAIPTSIGHDSLSSNSLKNLKKLIKRKFTVVEFEKATIAMFKNKWVHDTGNTGPAHLLIEDNFDRYYNQAVEQKIEAKVINKEAVSFDQIMNG